jgi:peptidoglycan/xylan/chitin deacetylase (PgdA/CDA1 family)
VSVFKIFIIIIFVTTSIALATVQLGGGFLFPIVSYSELPYLLSNQQQKQRQSFENHQNNTTIINSSTHAAATSSTSANSTSRFISNDGNSSDGITSNNRNNNTNSNRLAIINFDDGSQGQYIYSKPILDKYGFKATFFIVCNYVEKKNRMNWQEIESLYKEGYDIESHTMNHNDLSKISSQMLNYEIGQSKQCLLNHSINATIFAYPFAKGADNNSTVVNVVAKYYDLARTGFSPITFLKCNGWKQNSSQTDCRTYFDNGTLTFANRYSLRGWMHERVLVDNYTFNKNYQGNNNYNPYSNANYYYSNYSHDNYRTLQNFIKVVNTQEDYNKGGRINAIPIITYHKIVNGTAPYEKLKIPITTDVGLFEQEMKYLHDNGFRVISLKDIGYDQNTKYLYIKN